MHKKIKWEEAYDYALKAWQSAKFSRERFGHEPDPQTSDAFKYRELAIKALGGKL